MKPFSPDLKDACFYRFPKSLLGWRVHLTSCSSPVDRTRPCSWQLRKTCRHRCHLQQQITN